MNKYILALIATFFALSLSAQKNMTRPSVEGPSGLRVNSFSGNASYTRQDIFIESIGPDLDVMFSYKSNLRDRNRGFGNGWCLNIDKFYERDTNRISVEGTEGGKKFYTLNGGTWDAQPGVFDKLEEYSSNQFKQTDKFGMECFFENPTHQRVTKIADRCGIEMTLTYTDSLVTELTDASNRKIQFDWQDGKLIRVYHNLVSDITEYKFEYDANENLVKYINPLGAEIIYTYDDDNRLIGVVDENQTPTSIAYQSTGGVKQIASCDVVISFSYNPAKNETYVVEQIGAETVITTYNFDEDGKLSSKSGNCCGYNQEYTYDDDRNVTKRVDGNGEETIYNYDEMGNVTNRIDPLGNSISSTYDPIFNNPTQVTDELGTISNYSYDAKGNQLSFTNALNQTITATYDAFGNMLSETDRKGFTTTYQYDAYGYLSRVNFVDGSFMLMTYSATGNLLSRTNENGFTITFEYDLLDRPVKEIDPLGYETTYTYDGVGNNISITDQLGNTTELDYDGLGQLLFTTTAEGIITSNKYDAVGNLIETVDGNGQVYKAEYNIRNQVIKQIDPLGNEISFDYDGAGNRMEERDRVGNAATYTYDANNQVLTRTLPNGAVFTFEYDAAGQLLVETDPLGNTMTYSYDVLGRKIQETDQLGNTESYTYDANDNLLTTTDRRGNTITNTYDNRNRVITRALPLGQTVETTYDAVGNRLTISTAPGSVVTYVYNEKNQLTQETSPGGLITSYTYDAKGRVLTQTFANGNVAQFEYDKDDRLIRQLDNEGLLSYFEYDANGNRTLTLDSDSLKKIYVYDALNRVVSEEDGKGFIKIITYNPNGRVASQTNPLGQQTQITYNNISLPLEVTDEEGSTSSFTYDPLGNLKTITDAKGNVSQYVYDQKSRQVELIYPDGQSKTYVYDENDNVISRVERDGVTCDYVYDALDRQTAKLYPDGTSCTFQYTVQNQMIQANNANVNITFSHDLDGRLLTEQIGDKTISYSYDESTKTKTITYPNNTQVTEQLDFRDRTIEVLKGSTSLVNATYDGGRIAQKQYGNGIDVSYVRDANRLLESISDNMNLFHFKYAYDANENRISMEDLSATDRSQVYNYDAKQRMVNYQQGVLVSAAIPAPLSNSMYDYDEVGNRNSTDENGVLTTYTSNNINQYTSIIKASQNQTIQYTAKGDLSSDGIHTYTYDCDSRVKTIDGNVEYQYDALGRKYKRIAAGNTWTYYYYADQVILIDDEGGADKQYFYLGDSDIHLAYEYQNELYYFHEDALGNIIGLTDDNGAVLEKYSYDAFGNHSIFDANGNTLNASSVDNIFFYNGKELDSYANLYNYRNRNYQPAIGRFLQKDPTGYNDGLNLYSYVRNNPINYIDSYGLEAQGCFKIKTPELVKKLRDIGFLSQLKSTASKNKKFKMSLSGEVCNKCCSETGKRGQSYNVKFSASGSISGEANFLNGFAITRAIVLVARFASAKPFVGVNFNVSLSGSISYKINECGKESGGGCISLRGKVGAEISFKRKKGKGKEPINHDLSTGARGEFNAFIKACVFKGKASCKAGYSGQWRVWYTVDLGWYERAYEYTWPIKGDKRDCSEVLNHIQGLL